MKPITKALFFGKISVTPHAIEKAMDLFGFENPKDAKRFIIENLKQSVFVSEIMGETGKVDRLFAYRRIAFVVDRYKDVVITVYIRENADKELREKIRELLCDYLVQLSEKERAIEDRLILARAHGRPGEIAAAEAELARFRREKSKIAKGTVLFL